MVERSRARGTLAALGSESSSRRFSGQNDPCCPAGPSDRCTRRRSRPSSRSCVFRRRGGLTGSGSRRLPQQPLRAGHIGGRGRRFAPAYLLELFNARPSRRALPPAHADEGIELGAEELGHVRTDRLPRERWTLHAPNLGKPMCRNRVRTPAEVSGFDGGRPRHMGEAPAPTTCAPTDLRIEGGGEDLRNVRSTARPCAAPNRRHGTAVWLTDRPLARVGFV
jgi:hypothetical protein